MNIINLGSHQSATTTAEIAALPLLAVSDTRSQHILSCMSRIHYDELHTKLFLVGDMIVPTVGACCSDFS